MKMTLSYEYLSVHLSHLEGLGFPKSHALDVIGIKEADLAVHHERLEIDKFQACLTAAATFTSDSNIGLRLGDKFRVGSFGDTGNLYGHCENLKEVILMNNLYQKIAIDAGQVDYIQYADERHHMRFKPYYSDYSHYRLLTDMIMASFITAYRWLSWGSGEDILSVQLPYISEDEIPAYTKILQTQVKCGQRDIGLEFSDIAMAQKIPTHNPERLMRTRIKLDKILGKQFASCSFETAVEAAIRGAIEAGHVSSDSVAQRMRLSQSALRTQLSQTDEGIRPRIDKVRKSLFVEKFEAGLSFSQIAIDLAYNDQAAMNRAFRRWFGMTPTQWRLEDVKVDS